MIARAIAALALLLCGCRPSPEQAPLPPALDVEFAGCRSVVAGPICELTPDRVVRLWIRAPADAEVTVTTGGLARRPEGRVVQGGLLARVAVAESAEGITVTASRGGVTSTFRLATAPSHAAMAALDEAEELRKKGQLAGAEEKLDALAGDARPAVQAQVQRKRARIARVRGETARAVELLRGTIARGRAEGRISDAVEDQLALNYILVNVERRLDETRQGLDDLAPLLQAYPEGRAIVPYFRGLVAYEGNDPRAALGHFRAAAARTERLGVDDYHVLALRLWAAVLGILGRHGEAAALLHEAEAALPVGADACWRARLLNDAGWLALISARAIEARDEPVPDPLPLLGRALALSQGPCADPIDRPNLLINLALAELQGGQAGEAARRLAEAIETSRGAAKARGERGEAPLPPRLEVFRLLLEGLIALAERRPEEALPWFDRLAELGRMAAMPEARFEGALGRAEALEALDRVAAAGAAYDDMEAQLDDWLRFVPLGEGRETFIGRYEHAARLHVGFLLRRAGGDPASSSEAARAARRSRARLVAALDWPARVEVLAPAARARWEASLAGYRRARAAIDEKAATEWRLPRERAVAAVADRMSEGDRLRAGLDEALAALAPASRVEDPPTPREGELILVYHPVREDWVGFAIEAGAVTARPIGRLDPRAPPARLAAQLLAPFDDALARARSIRIAAFGALEHLDLHALPWRGRPLVARAPVAYGLDLPARPAAAPASPEAVVIGDPRGDLPGAREEARAVAALLTRRGLRVVHLEGTKATHEAVRRAIEQPGMALLHYTGHGVFEGRDGWESGLPLAAGGWLTVGDILSLSRVPDRVVLSGCDTARTTAVARGAGLGLGQAFVAAGAGAVVAASRPIGDALSARLVNALYEGAGGSPLEDLSAALRAAQLAVEEREPGADWASFRAIVR